MRPNINLTSFSWAKSQLLIGIVDSSCMLPLRAWLLSWPGRQVILCMLIAKQNNWRRLSGLFSLVAILKVPCVLQWPCISMTGVWARLCFSNIEMSWHIIMQSRCLSVHWLAHHSVAFSFLGGWKGELHWNNGVYVSSWSMKLPPVSWNWNIPPISQNTWHDYHISLSLIMKMLSINNE